MDAVVGVSIDSGSWITAKFGPASKLAGYVLRSRSVKVKTLPTSVVSSTGCVSSTLRGRQNEHRKRVPCWLTDTLRQFCDVEEESYE